MTQHDVEDWLFRAEVYRLAIINGMIQLTDHMRAQGMCEEADQFTAQTLDVINDICVEMDIHRTALDLGIEQVDLSRVR